MAAEISRRQNGASALRAARAFRRRYTLARHWRMVRFAGSALIGIVGIVLALFGPVSSAEYIGAIGAAWLLGSRIVMRPNERRLQAEGALAQEIFDTEVFDLPWNRARAGRPPAIEDLRNWGRHQNEEDLRDWYPDTAGAHHPVDALICQRAIVTWARQDHQTYARLLRGAAAVIGLAIIVLALCLGLTLGEFLLRLGLPYLPLAFEILDVGDQNSRLGELKLRLEEDADILFAEAVAGKLPMPDACRQLQDEIFVSRRGVGIPNWFYRVTRNERQENMEEVAAAMVAALPPSLKD
jgi:SMODS-associating 4TM effector domain